MPSIELKPLFEKKSDPLTLLMKDIFKDNNYALSTMGALALGLGVAQSSDLKADDAIEDIVVTASKRSENLQDVPMSVQAIGAAELDLKNVKGLDKGKLTKLSQVHLTLGQAYYELQEFDNAKKGAVLHRHIARMRGGGGVELGIKDQCL